MGTVLKLFKRKILCDRCNKSIVSGNCTTYNFKDGSKVILCDTCKRIDEIAQVSYKEFSL
jgi:RNase P subunit RPR2